jgi:hypothetical protein
MASKPGVLPLIALLALAVPASARVTAFLASQEPAARGVRLTWSTSDRSAPVEVSRDGRVLWSGVSDHFVDAAAPPGRHIYILKAAGASREVTITAPGLCVEPPGVVFDAPVVRWLGLGHVAEVLVSGRISQPAGCGALAASFRLRGPDGRDRDGSLDVSGERFSGTVYLDMSPGAGLAGSEKSYRVAVEAGNEAGAAGAPEREIVLPPRAPEPEL